jgi:hypothetical protein
MKKNQDQKRQGDVLTTRITKPNPKATPIPRDGGQVILAHGEVTGHAHAFAEPHVTHRKVNEIVSEVEIKEAMAMLTHDEHTAIPHEPGVYEVRRQQTYQRGEIKRVVD